MCGGGGGGDDYSQELREQEAERKRKLQQGLRELEQVFAPYYGESVQYTGPLAGDGGQPLSQQQFQSQIEQILAGTAPASTGTDYSSAPGWGDVTVDQLPPVGSGSGGPGDNILGVEPAPSGSGGDNILGIESDAPGGEVGSDLLDRSAPGRRRGRAGAGGGVPDSQEGGQRQQLAALGLTGDQIDVLLEDGDFDYEGAYHGLRYGDDYYDTQETGDPAWASVRQNYMDFANPQLERQYQSGAEDLTYALARGGQLTGTVGADRWSDLNQDLALRRQDVASQAEDYAGQRRQEILDLEQQYQNMLRSSSDPSLEGTNLGGQLSALSAPPSFESLGPLFQNTTAGLAAGYGGQQAYGTNQAVNNIMSGRGRYSRDPNRGSGRVVR